LSEVVSLSTLLNNWYLPVLAALIGWATNWLAIQLIFYPVQRKGIGSWLGWQGVIPRKARKMAAISVERTLARFGDLRSVFLQLQPERITAQILEQTLPRLEEYIDEVMFQHHAVLWDNLPLAMRARVYSWARAQLPRRIEALVADFGDELDELVDLQELFVEELHNHPELMVKIFKTAGEAELTFIIRSGLFFGFALGLLMTFSWEFMPAFWVLPLGGFLVGFLTNWLALNLIFRPLNPVTILGCRVQGLFLKRQKEVSRIWSQLVAQELITVEKVARSMVFGKHGHRTRAIIQRHIRPILDQSVILKLITQVAVGTAGFAELKRALQEKAVLVSTTPFHDLEFNKDRAPVVAQAIESRMSALSPAEFQDVLRPAFQEEEWQLMAIGGLLGGFAGIAQWMLLIG
jgi:uncharacterized membrane protein YheB (UPF0754 family)